MRIIRKTDANLRSLIIALKRAGTREESPLWRDVSERLSKGTRARSVVNLSRLNRYTSKGETVLVPGKVLSTGELDHELTVAAFAFSERAREKISASGGAALSIEALVRDNPKGNNVRLMV